MSKIFNTIFEVSIRLLLMLSIDESSSRTIDNLTLADFITNYSKEFGIADINLHGDNEFSFSEMALRRTSAQEAIKTLVLDGLVIIHQSENGFKYSISPKGITFCQTLTSVYAQEYRTYAEKTNNFMESKTEPELLAMISKRAATALRKE